MVVKYISDHTQLIGRPALSTWCSPANITRGSQCGRRRHPGIGMPSTSDPIGIYWVILLKCNSYCDNVSDERTGDLATAVRSAGLKFGAYHSWFEWFNPLYISDKSSNWKTRDFVNVCPRLRFTVKTKLSS